MVTRVHAYHVLLNLALVSKAPTDVALLSHTNSDSG